MLESWKIDCLENGYNINSLVASIEIVNANGQLERVYFPIPLFVLKYWSYPETQRSKEDLLMIVSRDSPEEKIGGKSRGTI